MGWISHVHMELGLFNSGKVNILNWFCIFPPFLDQCFFRPQRSLIWKFKITVCVIF